MWEVNKGAKTEYVQETKSAPRNLQSSSHRENNYRGKNTSLTPEHFYFPKHDKQFIIHFVYFHGFGVKIVLSRYGSQFY